MKIRSLSVTILTLATFLAGTTLSSQEIEKHRLMVLTDIEADPDDSQTLIRLLLYANVIDIEGLIATTSTHQRTRVAPESIHKLIDAYAKVQPKLNNWGSRIDIQLQPFQ